MEKKNLRKRLRKRIRSPSIRIDYSFIKILTGSDLSQRKLPLMHVKSINPGPIVWLTAGVHGEEVGGIVVIQEIFKKLRTQLLKGEVYAFPLMNPMGFETSSRFITLSEEDLNRSFPGDEEGSLAERIAEKIFTTILKTEPSLVLDLHNDWRESIPHILLDPCVGSKDSHEKAKLISSKGGFPIVLDTEEVENTLTYNLLKKGIPSFAIELGESFVVNEKDVEHGVKAIWNILTSLGMNPPFGETPVCILSDKIKNKILRYSPKPNSPKSGIIRFLVKPGEIVEKGKPIAKIYNTFGKLLETLKALDDGLVLGYSDYSVAFPGAPIIAFGVI